MTIAPSGAVSALEWTADSLVAPSGGEWNAPGGAKEEEEEDNGDAAEASSSSPATRGGKGYGSSSEVRDAIMLEIGTCFMNAVFPASTGVSVLTMPFVFE